MRIIGIDPGASGAIAVIKFGPAPRIINVVDMPTRQRGRRKTADARGVAETLADMIGDDERVAIAIEEAQAFPGQGATGAFHYGWTNGVVDAVARATGQPIEYIPPTVWKRTMRVHPPKRAGEENARAKGRAKRRGTTKEMKQAALDRATEVFGEDQRAMHFPNAGHDGRAEAALIAAALGTMRTMAQPTAEPSEEPARKEDQDEQNNGTED